MCKCKDISFESQELGQERVRNGLGIEMLMHIIIFGFSLIFKNVCIDGENIAHLVQSNKPMYT
jgi:hypothetical protein